MSAEPFDQEQPDDLAVWEGECAGIDKGYVIADEEPTPVPEGPMSEADRRRLYVSGHSDEPDPLAGARGVFVAALVMGFVVAAFAFGAFWPFGDWSAAGAW